MGVLFISDAQLRSELQVKRREWGIRRHVSRPERQTGFVSVERIGRGDWPTGYLSVKPTER